MTLVGLTSREVPSGVAARAAQVLDWAGSAALAVPDSVHAQACQAVLVSILAVPEAASGLASALPGAESFSPATASLPGVALAGAAASSWPHGLASAWAPNLHLPLVAALPPPSAYRPASDLAATVRDIVAAALAAGAEPRAVVPILQAVPVEPDDELEALSPLREARRDGETRSGRAASHWLSRGERDGVFDSLDAAVAASLPRGPGGGPADAGTPPAQRDRSRVMVTPLGRAMEAGREAGSGRGDGSPLSSMTSGGAADGAVAVAVRHAPAWAGQRGERHVIEAVGAKMTVPWASLAGPAAGGDAPRPAYGLASFVVDLWRVRARPGGPRYAVGFRNRRRRAAAEAAVATGGGRAASGGSTGAAEHEWTVVVSGGRPAALPTPKDLLCRDCGVFWPEPAGHAAAAATARCPLCGAEDGIPVPYQGWVPPLACLATLLVYQPTSAPGADVGAGLSLARDAAEAGLEALTRGMAAWVDRGHDTTAEGAEERAAAFVGIDPAAVPTAAPGPATLAVCPYTLRGCTSAGLLAHRLSDGATVHPSLLASELVAAPAGPAGATSGFEQLWVLRHALEGSAMSLAPAGPTPGPAHTPSPRQVGRRGHPPVGGRPSDGVAARGTVRRSPAPRAPRAGPLPTPPASAYAAAAVAATSPVRQAARLVASRSRRAAPTTPNPARRAPGPGLGRPAPVTPASAASGSAQRRSVDSPTLTPSSDLRTRARHAHRAGGAASAAASGRHRSALGEGSPRGSTAAAASAAGAEESKEEEDDEGMRAATQAELELLRWQEAGTKAAVDEIEHAAKGAMPVAASAARGLQALDEAGQALRSAALDRELQRVRKEEAAATRQRVRAYKAAAKQALREADELRALAQAAREEAKRVPGYVPDAKLEWKRHLHSEGLRVLGQSESWRRAALGLKQSLQQSGRVPLPQLQRSSGFRAQDTDLTSRQSNFDVILRTYVDTMRAAPGREQAAADLVSGCVGKTFWAVMFNKAGTDVLSADGAEHTGSLYSSGVLLASLCVAAPGLWQRTWCTWSERCPALGPRPVGRDEAAASKGSAGMSERARIAGMAATLAAGTLFSTGDERPLSRGGRAESFRGDRHEPQFAPSPAMPVPRLDGRVPEDDEFGDQLWRWLSRCINVCFDRKGEDFHEQVTFVIPCILRVAGWALVRRFGDELLPLLATAARSAGAIAEALSAKTGNASAGNVIASSTREAIAMLADCDEEGIPVRIRYGMPRPTAWQEIPLRQTAALVDE